MQVGTDPVALGKITIDFPILVLLEWKHSYVLMHEVEDITYVQYSLYRDE